MQPAVPRQPLSNETRGFARLLRSAKDYAYAGSQCSRAIVATLTSLHEVLLVGTFGGDDQHGASSQWYHCFCADALLARPHQHRYGVV